jgi:hypothetical protein
MTYLVHVFNPRENLDSVPVAASLPRINLLRVQTTRYFTIDAMLVDILSKPVSDDLHTLQEIRFLVSTRRTRFGIDKKNPLW